MAQYVMAGKGNRELSPTLRMRGRLDDELRAFADGTTHLAIPYLTSPRPSHLRQAPVLRLHLPINILPRIKSRLKTTLRSPLHLLYNKPNSTTIALLPDSCSLRTPPDKIDSAQSCHQHVSCGGHWALR